MLKSCFGFHRMMFKQKVGETALEPHRHSVKILEKTLWEKRASPDIWAEKTGLPDKTLWQTITTKSHQINPDGVSLLKQKVKLFRGRHSTQRDSMIKHPKTTSQHKWLHVKKQREYDLKSILPPLVVTFLEWQNFEMNGFLRKSRNVIMVDFIR